MARSPRPKGGVALCPRFTATSVAASSRTSRPSSIGRRERAPSSRCPNPRPVPVRPRWSTSTRPCSVARRMTRRRTARRPEKNTAPPPWNRGSPCRFRCCGLLQLHDVLRRGALLPLHDLEFDALALGQRLEPFSLNRGVMHEAVLAAAFGRNEAESLRVVEPLHSTGNACHRCVTP